jgi:hypothetical protein
MSAAEVADRVETKIAILARLEIELAILNQRLNDSKAALTAATQCQIARWRQADMLRKLPKSEENDLRIEDATSEAETHARYVKRYLRDVEETQADVNSHTKVRDKALASLSHFL